MARAALRWSLDDAAHAAGVGRATVARFELGQVVEQATVEAIEAAYAAHRVRCIKSGAMAGGVYRMRTAS